MLLLFAATSFACLNPSHHDGDNIRCSNVPGSMRLHGIDAPEMPGACRPGRACTPGDPYAARDYLRSLTRGRDVRCTVVDVDHYDRQVVECTADGQNIACEMIAGGQAVERYGSPDCGVAAAIMAPPTPAETAEAAPQALPPPAETVPDAAPKPPSPPVRDTTRSKARFWIGYAHAWFDERSPLPLAILAPLWLVLINLAGLVAMAIDKRRARARARRVPERRLFLIAWLGGGAGVYAGGRLFQHKSRKPPFAGQLLAITFVQLSAIMALLLMLR